MSHTDARSTTVVGVVFDLGNVLVDWQPFPAIAAGVGDDEARRLLTSDEFDFMAYNHQLDSGVLYADAEAALLRDFPQWHPHVEAFWTNFPTSLVGEVPGTADLIRELHAAGVPLFALTNWSGETFHHALDTYEVLGLMKDIVVSGTEGIAKPDHRIYQLTVERTGLPATDLAFVDDKQVNVDAAIEVGLHGLVFTDADRLRLDLRELGLPV